MTEISIPQSIATPEATSAPKPDDPGNMQRWESVRATGGPKIDKLPSEIATDRSEDKSPGIFSRAAEKVNPISRFITREKAIETNYSDPVYKEMASKIKSLTDNDRIVTDAINTGDPLEIADARLRATNRALAMAWGKFNEENPQKVAELMKSNPSLQKNLESYMRIKQGTPKPTGRVITSNFTVSSSEAPVAGDGKLDTDALKAQGFVEGAPVEGATEPAPPSVATTEPPANPPAAEADSENTLSTTQPSPEPETYVPNELKIGMKITGADDKEYVISNIYDNSGSYGHDSALDDIRHTLGVQVVIKGESGTREIKQDKFYDMLRARELKAEDAPPISKGTKFTGKDGKTFQVEDIDVSKGDGTYYVLNADGETSAISEDDLRLSLINGDITQSETASQAMPPIEDRLSQNATALKEANEEYTELLRSGDHHGALEASVKAAKLRDEQTQLIAERDTANSQAVQAVETQPTSNTAPEQVAGAADPSADQATDAPTDSPPPAEAQAAPAEVSAVEPDPEEANLISDIETEESKLQQDVTQEINSAMTETDPEKRKSRLKSLLSYLGTFALEAGLQAVGVTKDTAIQSGQ